MTPRPPTRVRPQVRRSHSKPTFGVHLSCYRNGALIGWMMCEVVVTRTTPLLDADEDAELTAMLKERVFHAPIDDKPRTERDTLN